MIPALEELKTQIEQALEGVALTVEAPAIIVQPKDLLKVLRFLKDAEKLQLDYLANLTAIDYLPAALLAAAGAAQAGPPEGRIDVVYHLYSMAQKHGPVVLKVKLPRANPVLDSAVPVWRGAEYQEREAYDLYGVKFSGHPDLRRILMWEGFDGHPMRKDYVPENQNAPLGNAA